MGEDYNEQEERGSLAVPQGHGMIAYAAAAGVGAVAAVLAGATGAFTTLWAAKKARQFAEAFKQVSRD